MKRPTSPFQCALSTRAGCECTAHALQALTEVNPDATIRQLMGLGPSIWYLAEPCCKDCVTSLRQQCRLFVNSAEACPVICEHVVGEVPHRREGGEQGDPMMPMLLSLGHRNTLRAVQTKLEEGELVFALIYAILAGRVVAARADSHSSWEDASLETLWLLVVTFLDRAARALDPEFTTVWRGGGEPAHQGIVILGTPLVTRISNTLWKSTTFRWSVQSAWSFFDRQQIHNKITRRKVSRNSPDGGHPAQ